jgi:hypothetical protein
MNMKMNVLFNAQPFGYGPAAKAIAIASNVVQLNLNVKVFFAGTGAALDIVKRNDRIFCEVYPASRVADIMMLIKKHNIDLVVSVMAPEAVVAARYCGVSSVIIDSLYWFWNWDQLLQKDCMESIKDDFKMLHQYPNRYLKHFSPHEKQLVSHLLADKSYVQTITSDKSVSRRKLNKILDMKLVGPIIDDRFIDSSVQKDTIMIAMCGQLNPIVRVCDAVEYGKLILRLLEPSLTELFRSRPRLRLLITGNENVLNKLWRGANKLPIKNITVGHLEHSKYLLSLNRCRAIITAPSLTTCFEAFAYGAPLIFLPEQHDGHYPNYLYMEGRKKIFNSKKTPVFPGALLTSYFSSLEDMPEEGIKTIYTLIKKMNRGYFTEIFCDMQKTYERIVPRLSNDDFCKALHARQRKAQAGVSEISPASAVHIIANDILLLK